MGQCSSFPFPLSALGLDIETKVDYIILFITYTVTVHMIRTYVCIIGSSECVHPPTLNITCTAWSNVPLRNCFPFGSTDMETYKMGVRNKCVDG